jgi:hypothetical protein
MTQKNKQEHSNFFIVQALRILVQADEPVQVILPVSHVKRDILSRAGW